MTAPVDRDQATRDRLAKALNRAGYWSTKWLPERQGAAGLAAALLPVVADLVREGQAEALGQWARTFRVVAVASMTRQRRRIGAEVADLLEAEAAALRAPRAGATS